MNIICFEAWDVAWQQQKNIEKWRFQLFYKSGKCIFSGLSIFSDKKSECVHICHTFKIFIFVETLNFLKMLKDYSK